MKLAEAQRLLGIAEEPADTEAYRSAVQSAWRGFAKRYHPDMNKDPSATALFHQYKQASDILNAASRGELPEEDQEAEGEPEDLAADVEQLEMLLQALLAAMLGLRQGLQTTAQELDETEDTLEELIAQFNAYRQETSARMAALERAVNSAMERATTAHRVAAARPVPAPAPRPAPTRPPGQWDPPAPRARRATKAPQAPSASQQAMADTFKGLDAIIDLVKNVKKKRGSRDD